MPTIRELIAGSQHLNPKRQPPSPEVSILLPTYRRGSSGRFKKCVESLLLQTYSNFELIIVDDHSVDGTFDQIMSFMGRDSRISCIRHDQHIGLPAISEFEAYKKSEGDFLFYAFDDHEFYPDALNQLVTEFKHRNADMIFGVMGSPFKSDDEKDEISNNFEVIQPYTDLLESHNFVAKNAVLLRRDVIKVVGSHDPHVVLVKQCGWDLWRRISHEYLIQPVPIAVGRECEPNPLDNLPAPYDVDYWAINEWVKRPGRNAKLLPENFEDYDVTHVPTEASSFFKDSVAETLRRFSHPLLRKEDKPKENGRLLVVSSTISASVSLCFNSLPSSNDAIRIVDSSTWPANTTAGARAVIFVRDIFGFGRSNWMRYTNIARIPHYFFVDDNFTILAQNGSKEYREWLNLNNLRSRLSSFSGVLLSTPELLDYYDSNNLHDNLLLYPPIRQSINYSGPRKRKPLNTFRIGFLGGQHRLKSFISLVIPAIISAKEGCNIEIAAAGVPEDDLRAALEGRGISWTSYPFDISYRATMMRMLSEDLDILIHPGEDTANHRYKTTNVLINADILGVAALVSDTKPYSDLPKLGVCLTAKDDERSWHSAIVDLLSNPALRRNLVEANRNYCRLHFDGRANELAISQIIERHPFGAELLGRRHQALSAFIADDVTNSLKLKRSLQSSWNLVTLIAKNRFRQHILDNERFQINARK
jgi:glycosyltransferase involved in cell wall biosynthesis